MDYTRTLYVYGCGGSICDEDWTGSSSTYYSDTWEPPADCHLYGTGVKTTFKVDPEGLDHAVAYLYVEAGYDNNDDLDSGNGIQKAIVTLTDVAQDNDSSWCYYSSFAGYAIDTH